MRKREGNNKGNWYVVVHSKYQVNQVTTQELKQLCFYIDHVYDNFGVQGSLKTDGTSQILKLPGTMLNIQVEESDNKFIGCTQDNPYTIEF